MFVMEEKVLIQLVLNSYINAKCKILFFSKTLNKAIFLQITAELIKSLCHYIYFK